LGSQSVSSTGRQVPAFGDEPDGQRVHAMTGVLPGEAFPFEDVAQVTAAVGADYFCTTPVRVRMALHASWVFFIEARPAAQRRALCPLFVQSRCDSNRTCVAGPGMCQDGHRVGAYRQIIR
jgi:hypothetical protein